LRRRIKLDDLLCIGDEVVKDWYSEISRVDFKNVEAGYPSTSLSFIPRLHDQPGSTSCYVLAGRASSMFARSRKWGTTDDLLLTSQ